MTKDKDCIFCKIISKEIPAEIVYEDNKFLALLDINPVSPGHTLLIPKTHHIWMQEAPDDLIGNIFIQAKKIMLALKKTFNSDYVKIGVVGNEIPHFHIHIIPKKNGDKNEGGSRLIYKDKKQLTECAENIRRNL
jgi:histidine triad (HIT) family protein